MTGGYQKGSCIKRGNQWKGRFTEYVGSERIYRSVVLGPVDTMSKPEAKRKLLELIRAKGISSEVRTVSPVQTFKQKATFWEDNIACHFKPATRRTMLNHLKKHINPVFGSLPLDLITETSVQEFITKLHKGGLAPKSTLNIVGVIKLVVGQRVWRDWTLKMPANPHQEQPYFTQEQMTNIIKKTPVKYQALFSLLAGTGMRIGEACGLHVSDIDLVKNIITIRRSVWGGKEQEPKTSNAHRRVTIDQTLSEVLKTHINAKSTGYLFPNRKKGPLCANNVAKRVLKPVLEELKIEGSFHSFRHGRVSILQQKGVPSDLVREWIGHSSLRMTSKYTHFSDDFRKEIVEGLSHCPTST